MGLPVRFLRYSFSASWNAAPVRLLAVKRLGAESAVIISLGVGGGKGVCMLRRTVIESPNHWMVL